MEKINTPSVEEVQGLEDTVRGVGGFGNTGVNEKKDIGEKSEGNGQNKRTSENNKMVKNETLKGKGDRSCRTRIGKKEKTTEGSSRLSWER